MLPLVEIIEGNLYFKELENNMLNFAKGLGLGLIIGYAGLSTIVNVGLIFYAAELVEENYNLGHPRYYRNRIDKKNPYDVYYGKEVRNNNE